MVAITFSPAWRRLSSAVLAVLYREPDAERYETAIATAQNCRMSIANVLEASIVVEGRGGEAAGHEFDAFLNRAGIALAPLMAEHVEAARLAWRRFGKGNQPAGLNFGDCFAYALAKTTGEPLLCERDNDPIGESEVSTRWGLSRPDHLLEAGNVTQLVLKCLKVLIVADRWRRGDDVALPHTRQTLLESSLVGAAGMLA